MPFYYIFSCSLVFGRSQKVGWWLMGGYGHEQVIGVIAEQKFQFSCRRQATAPQRIGLLSHALLDNPITMVFPP
jgi:hypothetical protein